MMSVEAAEIAVLITAAEKLEQDADKAIKKLEDMGVNSSPAEYQKRIGEARGLRKAVSHLRERAQQIRSGDEDDEDT